MTIVLFGAALIASSPALADTHYMLCFGGGRAALYYSGVFAVPGETKSGDTAKAFNAYVKNKYGATIYSECHRDASQASANADKKSREAADQSSKFRSKLIETGWAGK